MGWSLDYRKHVGVTQCEMQSLRRFDLYVSLSVRGIDLSVSCLSVLPIICSVQVCYLVWLSQID